MNHDDNGTAGESPAVSRANDVTTKLDSSEEKPPVIPSSPTKPEASEEEDVVTKVLQFLSTATPATLAAIAVGLAAITYFVLGQLGLLLIGAFAGITLFVTWEARHPEVSRAVRGEKGYEFLDRLYETRSSDLGQRSEQNDEDEEQTLMHSFDDFQPETRDALNGFVDAVIRDYVDWWYGPIVPSDKSFPLSCRRTLTRYMLNLSNRLSRKRPADAFVDFVTHSCSIIIVFFAEMASAYNGLPSDANTTAADVIYNYLASKPEAPLSNLLNQKQQAGKFKMVAEDLLDFLERSTYDCDPARVFLREILSTIILEGTLQTCSKAEWINAWIVYLLESGETDLSQAIDEAIQDQKAFGDVDGNVGNIGLSKGNRNSYEMDRARRKEQTHKKKLSRADEEMERAMEEMKRLNEMIAEADKEKNPSGQEGQTPSVPVQTPQEEKTRQPSIISSREQAAGDATAAAKVASPELLPEAKAAPEAAQLEKTEPRQGPVHSPAASRSTLDLSSPDSSSANQQDPANAQRFTSFDQLKLPPGEQLDDGETRKPPPLTLHNATITLHDDCGNDKGRLRNRPTWEYLVQIEPSVSQHPGWMVMKTYIQFEELHESLRRIAAISGSTGFLEAHSTFPSWKLHTRSSLRGDMERYMRAACAEKVLAESEAMKRFLDKAQETKAPANKFSFESMGKGMLGAIQSAPKGAFDGGKSVVGGINGVFSNIGLGQRKSTISSLQESQPTQPAETPSPPADRPMSLPVLPRLDSTLSVNSAHGSKVSRDSLDSQRSSVVSTQPGKMPPMERRPSYQADADQESLHPARADRWERNPLSATSSRVHSRASSTAALRSPLRSPSEISLSNMKLPPPPTEIADDYGSPTSTRLSMDGNSRLSTSLTSPARSSESDQQRRFSQANVISNRRVKQHAPLSEQETRVAVELLFAVINELYTLSSAWNIRRTLLTAAKSFLLRPGNPSLVSIQSLMQESVLDVHTSDSGIATHLRKLRENSLPTEEERKAWPAELSSEEKEELRVKARKLFIQSSVPAALMGIMGQSATSEALGRVFDCLQVEEVARGLFFGIILQAVRVITH
ncbi:PXA domain-containing protein [Xylariomycetidae sp. FL0641]|nr:PXA domain-containing protein [Xylariomycetidae sp. FL0641]